MTSDDRPAWTAARAARECGVGRSTIMRALADGRIGDARQDQDGAWAIPVTALIAAGFTPGKPSPPDSPVTGTGHGVTRPDDRSATGADQQVSGEIERLRSELVAITARAAAAEALATEREARIADLKSTLLMIEGRKPKSLLGRIISFAS